MPRPQVNDADQRLVLKDGQRPEISVVAYHNAALRCRQSQQVHVGGPVQATFDNVKHVEAELAPMSHDYGIEVFVCQRGKITQLQSPTSAVTRTSLRTAAAA